MKKSTTAVMHHPTIIPHPTYTYTHTIRTPRTCSSRNFSKSLRHSFRLFLDNSNMKTGSCTARATEDDPLGCSLSLSSLINETLSQAHRAEHTKRVFEDIILSNGAGGTMPCVMSYRQAQAAGSWFYFSDLNRNQPRMAHQPHVCTIDGRQKREPAVGISDLQMQQLPARGRPKERRRSASVASSSAWLPRRLSLSLSVVRINTIIPSHHTQRPNHPQAKGRIIAVHCRVCETQREAYLRYKQPRLSLPNQEKSGTAVAAAARRLSFPVAARIHSTTIQKILEDDDVTKKHERP